MKSKPGGGLLSGQVERQRGFQELSRLGQRRCASGKRGEMLTGRHRQPMTPFGYQTLVSARWAIKRGRVARPQIERIAEVFRRAEKFAPMHGPDSFTRAAWHSSGAADFGVDGAGDQGTLPSMKPIFKWSFAASALALVLVACSTVPITGRQQVNIFSQGEEAQLGLSSFTQMKKEQKISTDAAATAMLLRVGKRIAAVAGPDMPNAQWEFVLFDSKEANAFCLPGGKVGVYAGILPITKDEDGLAVVLGHEIAHAVARHGGERMTKAMGLQLGGQLVGAYANAKGVSAENIQLLNTAYGIGSQVGLSLPHDRAQESEADRIGLTYMARAGYRPEAAVDFWKRFSEFNRRAGGAGTPWFLRTHPLDETRIQQIQQWLPEARAQFKPAQ